MAPKKKGPVYDSSKEYKNRAEIDPKIFNPLTITAQEPETLLLLLASKEDEVLLRTLQHLSKFAENHENNATTLNQLKIVQKTLENKLERHEVLYIKRFAMKIFATITELKDQNFDDRLVAKLYFIAYENYINSTDSFMVEFAAVILYNLFREPRVCAALERDTEFMKTMFGHIASTNDVDVLHYTYKLLIKLFNTASSILQFCDIEAFPFERVLGDVTSDYPEIQEDAINIFKEIGVCKNEFYETKFICPLFFEELFKVLENDLWVDRHPSVLEVFKKLMNNQAFANVFCRNEYLARFVHYTKNKDLYKLKALGVLVEIAQFDDFLDDLFIMSVVTLLKEFLQNLNMVNSDVCLGIKRMLRHLDSFNKIITEDPVPFLTDIIKTDYKDWDVRDAAASALCDILKRSHKCCESAVKNSIGNVIGQIFKQPYGQVPVDFLLNLINILVVLAKDPDIRSQIMSGMLPKSLAYATKTNMRSTILAANFFNCDTAFISEQPLENEFLTEEMIKTVLNALRSPAVVVKNAAADFIVVTGKLLKFSDEYIDNGILEYLFEDDKALTTCPSWSLAIESILSINPSFKFLIRGRLEITDIIGDGFVASKYQWKDFKILRRIQHEEVSPFYPLILVNLHNVCGLPDCDQMRTTFECHGHECVHEDFLDNLDLSQSESLESEQEWTYCRLPTDTHLSNYLNQLRKELEVRGLVDASKVPNCIDIVKIADRAKTIAQIVSKEMCGEFPFKDPNPSMETSVLNHLNELKCQLHCNIIPLGSIRYGAHFERAILFKVLADQIGLPATLVRGVDNRILYNEIPIPEQTETPDCSLTILPMRLLYPTHIVDLVDYPGALYPLESRRAYKYLRLL